MRKRTAKSRQGPKKSNIVKKKMKTIEKKKIFFSEQKGYFEGNLFFFPFQFCVAYSFLMEIIFFFQIEAPSCAVRASCLPNLERLARRGSGGGEAAGGSLGLGREAGGRAGQALGPCPAPLASDSRSTSHHRSRSGLILLSQQLAPLPAHSHGLCPHASSCPGHRSQVRGVKEHIRERLGHPDSLPTRLLRPRCGGAGRAVPKGVKAVKPPTSARKPGKEG